MSHEDRNRNPLSKADFSRIPDSEELHMRFHHLAVMFWWGFILNPLGAVRAAEKSILNAKIAYIMAGGGNGTEEIYTFDPEERHERQLTKDGGYKSDLAWSPDGKQIAFSCVKNGDPDIYVMNSDGTNRVRLLHNTLADYAPAWSPDCQQIAFVSKRGPRPYIYIVNTDGTNVRRLTKNDAIEEVPSWSPDGTRIVYKSRQAFDTGEYRIVALDGRILGRFAVGGHTTTVRWSPDGSELLAVYVPTYRDEYSRVFLLNGDGTNRRSLNISGNEACWSPDGTRMLIATGGDIISVNRDGSDRTVIVPGTPRRLRTSVVWSPFLPADVDPKPSVDVATPKMGERFAAQTQSIGLTVRVKNHVGTWCWRVNQPFPPRGIIRENVAKGSDEVVLSGLKAGRPHTIHIALLDSRNALLVPLVIESRTFSLESPASSSRLAGTKILFLQYGEKPGIYTVNPDGTGQQLLRKSGTGISSVTWSPDGTKILFSANSGTVDSPNYDLYVMTANGSKVKRLTDWWVYDIQPSWSPDGTLIVWTVTHSGVSYLYVARSDGTESRRLHTGGHSPKWSPDGSRIAFYVGSTIFSIHPNGSHLTSLTGSSTIKHGLSWSPDSTEITFGEMVQGRIQLIRMNADGTDLRVVRFWSAVSAIAIESVSWSPDGSRIAYTLSQRNGTDVYILNVDGSKPIRVTSNPDGEAHISWSPFALPALTSPAAWDVNRDGVVDIHDLLAVEHAPSTKGNYADVNGDGSISISDLMLVSAHFGEQYDEPDAPAPQLPSTEHFPLLTKGLSDARRAYDGSETFRKGIRVLERLIDSIIPDRTALLPNYPNPFNPETWIPFDLSNRSDVILRIYDVSGNLVRDLSLGERPAGTYRTRDRAARWDGRNAHGEQAASGTYVIELRAGSLGQIRRLLIRK